ncbi:mannose-1-phosphate guanylyltransferase [Pseudomonas fluorescens]|nr:mannose-1-phosphate guanylyltransferase [Pseudomonas fluorescens]
MAWLRTYESVPSTITPQPKLLVERVGLFPSSGDIPRTVVNPIAVLEYLRTLYVSEVLDVDDSDGLSLTLSEWRFKICPSESEILLKVESRGDVAMMQKKTAELLDRIEVKNSSESW